MDRAPVSVVPSVVPRSLRFGIAVVLTAVLCGWTITAVYAALLSVSALAAIAGLLAASAIPWRVFSVKVFYARVLVFVAAVGLMPLLSGAVIAQANRHCDVLSRKIDSQGARGLGFVEWSGLYLLGLTMVAGGFAAGYDEVAQEQLLMYVQGPKVRVFDDDFAMSSEKVRLALVDFARRLEATGASVDALAMTERRIALDGRLDAQRVSLALNPLDLAARATRQGRRWQIAVAGRVDVRYPRHARVTLFSLGGVPFQFEEGLFWALQERGLLHPYVAEWRWTLTSDDRRLRGG